MPHLVRIPFSSAHAECHPSIILVIGPSGLKKFQFRHWRYGLTKIYQKDYHPTIILVFGPPLGLCPSLPETSCFQKCLKNRQWDDWDDHPNFRVYHPTGKLPVGWLSGMTRRGGKKKETRGRHHPTIIPGLAPAGAKKKKKK